VGRCRLPAERWLYGALGAAYSAEMYAPESGQVGFIQGLIFVGYLLFYLTKKHCYDDGNKRIAWACTAFVLLSFGLTIEATEDEVVNFCLSIAKGDVKDGAEAVRWISDRLVPVA
jgi:death on curing protein